MTKIPGLNLSERFGEDYIAFLLSDDSQYMTGQTLMEDGGDIKLRW
ncbi:MAG TPA: hypothetical protein PKN99_11540 [Cyclobacteriaceae bacterium]|jgi:NAD(P)-dependent dehydrogenase (short-subunit alcohol dehydrogenase family)|nr:hypothetical protein [Chitinophagaceae bacterium]HNP08253.1 hypothetical protein [Cyclobacteriaceae bacterium]